MLSYPERSGLTKANGCLGVKSALKRQRVKSGLISRTRGGTLEYWVPPYFSEWLKEWAARSPWTARGGLLRWLGCS